MKTNEINTGELRIEPELLDLSSPEIEEVVTRAKAYHGKEIKIMVVNKILVFVVLLMIMLLEISSIVSSLVTDNSLVDIALVTISIIIILQVIRLPLFYYGELVEISFDFSTRSRKRWFRDFLVETIIYLIIGIIALELLYIIISALPEYWWFFSFLGYFVFASILASLVPVIIIPLFMKINPLPQGPVRERVETLARSMNLNYKDIYELKMSDQTTKDNAMVAGFGKTIRILLGDNLIRKYRIDEIESIMAHEIAHQKNRDIYRSILVSGFLSLIAFYIIDTGYPFAASVYSYTSKSDPASVSYFVFMFWLLSEILNIIALAFMRYREKRADLDALKYTRNPQAQISAHLRAEKENLIYPYPSKLEVWLTWSHPPIRKRVDYVMKAMEKEKEKDLI
ncbi:MAG: M48 family metalloprotease [Candidatus Hodarchaeales archaeon]